jgi:carbamoyltransferase
VYIIGINAGRGDTSCCLLKDGELIAAIQEERLRRVKFWTGFPALAFERCLAEAGIGIGQVAHIAIDRGAAQSLAHAGAGQHWFEAFAGEIHEIDPALASLCAAFHVSPFESAVALAVDGAGQAACAWGVGQGSGIAVEGSIAFPHSLGIFYQAMTQWLGFPRYGDEYKVMGLASYGRPEHMEAMRRLVKLKGDGGFELALDYFRHHHAQTDRQSGSGEPRIVRLFSDALTDLLGPMRGRDEAILQRHMDVAHSAQAMVEEALFHLLNSLYERYRLDRLALAGGCALNSVANGKIGRATPFRELYVPPAPGAAGTAVGAAFALWHRLGGARGFVMRHAYWGPQFGVGEIAAVLQARGAELEAQGCTITPIADQDALCERSAHAIADGKVVGWFHGRMEWGPRALGNRSILGDPRRADMKDILNLKIKRREPFRPFAPSILREAVAQWFETDADVPFMSQVCPVRDDKRALIPAVTHVDGSGRLQTVERTSTPRFHALIEAFERISGVPLLLNTSFNENEPVVCHPEEALDCFLRTGMDLLVLENWFVERSEALERQCRSARK